MIATQDHPLTKAFAQTLSAGLRRKSINTCSRWSQHYRIMGMPIPGKWDFDHHPWLRGMHDCDDYMMVGMKAAQMGYTETALNKVFFNIDVRGKSCLYVLPASTPDASDFSSSRFDPALELSPHLQNMFSDVKNVGHKRAGAASLFIRGSRSRSQLKSLPVSQVVCDEVDEMAQDNIAMIPERMSGQKDDQTQIFFLSTPTIGGHGIAVYWDSSNQMHYMFQCPSCSRFTELDLDECLVITADDHFDPAIKNSHLICKECKAVLPHETKKEWLADKVLGGTARWEATYANRLSTGFHVNQLYSTMMHPYKIAQMVLQAKSDPNVEQELYNSKMGLPHEVEGARIKQEDLDAVTGSYSRSIKSPNTGRFVTMGVDVGKWLHLEICEWVFDRSLPTADISLIGRPRVLRMDKVKDFEELDQYMLAFKVGFCVVDHNPETRKAKEFARRFYGRVRLCLYTKGTTGKEIVDKGNEEMIVNVNRTSWLDLSLGRFHNGKISIPADTPKEYKDHLKALVRIYGEDADGNPIGKYVNTSDDHYGHARNYAEIALPLGFNLMKSKDVTGVV